MRRYELTFVLAPTLSEEEVEQYVETLQQAIDERGAKTVNVDQWGKRRLAYPIKKHREGIYTVLTLEEEAAEAIAELERRFRVSDSVIRFLSVRIDEDLKRAEKLKKRRDGKKKPPLKSPPQPTAEMAAVEE